MRRPLRHEPRLCFLDECPMFGCCRIDVAQIDWSGRTAQRLRTPRLTRLFPFPGKQSQTDATYRYASAHRFATFVAVATALLGVTAAACVWSSPATADPSDGGHYGNERLAVGLMGAPELSPGPGDPSTAPPLPGGRSCGAMTSSFGAIYASNIWVRRISCRRAKRVLR